jgi:hypothetical protein
LPLEAASQRPIHPTVPHEPVAVGKVASASEATEPPVPEAVAKEEATLAYEPTDAGTGTEVSGGSYARVASSFATASGTGGSVASDADATFPTATGSWGTVGWIGLWDAASSGNLLYHTALDAAKTIDSGDVFKIASGNLTVTLA